MKKLLLILLCFMYFTTISYAENYSLKGLKHLLALLEKDITEDNPNFSSSFEYIKKNSVKLKAEVIQVVEDTDTISFFIANVSEGGKMKSITAVIETLDEIIYEGKEFENLNCFLVGTFTYTNKLDEQKTVPLYFTLDCLYDYVTKLLNP